LPGGTGNRVTGTSTPAPTQGNNGSYGEYNLTPFFGGGGGGAGSASVATPVGGNGLASSISGSSVTYAGGGSGGARAPQPVGGATPGGGGAGGAVPGTGGNGTVNTGGGGGGSQPAGGSGGSGIVVIRYPI
jgi:hypothetical protein